MGFEKTRRIPLWCMYSLIVLTAVLSVVILLGIWFPDLVDFVTFLKIFWTYVVIIVSAGLITRMANYIRSIERRDGRHESGPGDPPAQGD